MVAGLLYQDGAGHSRARVLVRPCAANLALIACVAASRSLAMFEYNVLCAELPSASPQAQFSAD